MKAQSVTTFAILALALSSVRGSTLTASPTPTASPAPTASPVPSASPTPKASPTPTASPAPAGPPLSIKGLVDPKGAAAGPSAKPPVDPHTYVVVRGDTLLGISRRLKVSFSALQRENKIRNPDKIQAGQVLRIPVRPGPVRRPTKTIVANSPNAA